MEHRTRPTGEKKKGYGQQPQLSRESSGMDNGVGYKSALYQMKHGLRGLSRLMKKSTINGQLV